MSTEPRTPAPRKRYVYRLHVEWPTGAPTRDVYDPHSDGVVTTTRPPAVSRYLTPAGAEHRARVLRSQGATVTVERSNPITWPGDQQ